MDGILHLVVGNAGGTVQDQCHRRCSVDCGKTRDIKVRGKFIEPVGRTDGHRQGVYAGTVHKLHGLLRGGEAAALLLTKFCHVAKFGLYVGPVRLCHFHGFGRSLHVFLEGFLGGIYHHGVEAFVQAALHQFQAGAMVKVDVTTQTVILNYLPAHLVSRVKAHVVDRRPRKLQHYRSIHGLCSLCHAGKGLEIIKVGCQDCGLVCLALIQDFFDSFFHKVLCFCYANLTLFSPLRNGSSPSRGLRARNRGQSVREGGKTRAPSTKWGPKRARRQ